MKQSVIFVIFLIFVTDICDTVSQLLLKSSINSLDFHVGSIKKVIKLIVQLIKIPRVLVGFVFSAISLLMWLFVLTKADLNFAFSIDSMTYIFIAFASRHVLKEKVGFKRWSGTIFIIIGIILVSLS